MKGFIKICVEKPVAVFMGIIAVLLLGFISLSRLAIDFLPNMEVPYITILTQYDNAGPEEIEKSITRLIERAVASVNNVKTITSSSEEGESRVNIEFNWGSDLSDAAADIREALDIVKGSLPDDAESPRVFKFSTDMIPIMYIFFYGTENLAALYNYVDTQIVDRIEQAQGVARAEIRGGLQSQIKVDVDMNRLQAYGLDINSIVSILSIENQNLAGGQTYEGVYKYILRTTGEFKNLDDIGNVVVALKENNVPVRLRDVAEIYNGYNENIDKMTMVGTPAVAIAVNKESGGNAVAVDRAVKEQLNNLQLPEGIECRIVFNTADTVNQAIAGVLDTAWQGGLFAVIILMIYLWNFRTVSIIAISIPMSIIITFTIMYFVGVTLNIISLAGLVLGIGMMVDNSIVVLENIFFYRNNGYGKYSAAIEGTYTVSLAILASTLTTIAVFLPFLFVQGQTGQMFRDLCITVTVSMIASLGVALTIVPMLGARLITGKKSKRLAHFESFFNKYFHSKVNFIYNKILTYSVNHKNRVLIPTLIIVFVVIIIGLIFIGKEGFPVSDEGQFRVNIRMPVGTRMEQTESFTKRMEADLVEAAGEDLDYFASRVYNGSDANRSEVNIMLRRRSEGRDLSINEYMEIARNRLVNYPANININPVNYTAMRMGSGGASGEISIEIIGDDLSRGNDIANRIIEVISEVRGVRDARLGEDDSNPEINISINRDLASKMGLNANTVATAIRTGFGGTTATTITPDGSDVTDIDIEVRLKERDRINVDDIRRMMIPTSAGMVPISSIADIERTYGPTAIERKDNRRLTEVRASGYGRPINQIVEDIQSAINSQIYIPPGFSINYSGDYEDMQDAFGQLLQAVILALVLVYAVMATQFESYIAPFVIALAIPFGFAGSILLLLIMGQTLSVYSGIGIIVLIGVVVNNGIVLIDYMNQLMHEKKINGDKAALIAGPRRLRPVLMTSLTTILGLLPMALASGEGNEMYKPLSIALLGGLSVSTMFTLVIVPTVYAAIRNRVPLKDYKAKDEASVESVGNIGEALEDIGE